MSDIVQLPFGGTSEGGSGREMRNTIPLYTQQTACG